MQISGATKVGLPRGGCCQKIILAHVMHSLLVRENAIKQGELHFINLVLHLLQMCFLALERVQCGSANLAVHIPVIILTTKVSLFLGHVQCAGYCTESLFARCTTSSRATCFTSVHLLRLNLLLEIVSLLLHTLEPLLRILLLEEFHWRLLLLEIFRQLSEFLLTTLFFSLTLLTSFLFATNILNALVELSVGDETILTHPQGVRVSISLHHVLHLEIERECFLF
mmetsp:Transcript_11481/g.43091  ORF Transcript_11481/g.43091 Transcript_11481/m.43091 type:complete len:225 (+) Transcript_11481:405-1079(+)